MSLRDRLAALLGISAYQPPKGYGLEHDDTAVESIREAFGGNLSPMPRARTRWYVEDLERAAFQCDDGNIELAAQLCQAMRRDGTISGLLGTLTSGIVRLPKKFYGKYGVEELKARNGSRSVFDDMFPPSEVALLADDGKKLGVGVAELVPVPGRDFPIMIRLEPQYLRYRWIENRWYFLSVAGPLPITPGDGRWILHTPGGRNTPWRSGLWPSLGRSFIHKEHAMQYRANYVAKLANAARVAVMPQGAAQEQKQEWFDKVMAWGVNTVFGMTPGYDVRLLESNGKGFEVFQAAIETSDKEIAIQIAGQLVTVDGGAGFTNMDMFRAIQSDIIKDTADGLAYTLNTQGLPQYIVSHHGDDALDEGAMLEWDISRPKDVSNEATAMQTAANAVKAWDEFLTTKGKEIDIDELVTRFGVPIKGDANGDGVADANDREPAQISEARARAAKTWRQAA
jgi:hypothetical protein